MHNRKEVQMFKKGISELFKVFDIDLRLTKNRMNYVFYEPSVILPSYIEVLEAKASEQVGRFSQLDKNIDYNTIQFLFAELRYDNLMSVRMGLDFDLELREQVRFITEDRYPSLWLAFVKIPGDKGHGLNNENHGFGYHIHYIEFQSKKRKRTDVVFTFDPSENQSQKMDTLYWFNHGTGKHIIHHNPNAFGIRRKKSIYDCATPFLGTISKTYFQNPPNRSAILYP